MITRRNLKYLCDYSKVYDFLIDNYQPKNSGGNLMPAAWEYLFCHPYTNVFGMSKGAVWEDHGKMVGVVHIEFDCGEVIFEIAEGYDKLLGEMLEYAEAHLVGKNDEGENHIHICIPSQKEDFVNLLTVQGYQQVWTEYDMLMKLDRDFEVSLPQGYKIITLDEIEDGAELARAVEIGFDHTEEELADVDFEANARITQAGAHFRADLKFAAIAPDGTYAGYAGYWYDERTDIGYLEPLCVLPQHRNKGIATALVHRGMNACKALGAQYASGGMNEFYTKIGYEKATEYFHFEKKFA